MNNNLLIDEVFTFVGLLPLMSSNARAKVLDQATCSDASIVGGGVCHSVAITDLGRQAMTRPHAELVTEKISLPRPQVD